MAKITYDVTDVEVGEGGNQPKPGVYDATIAQVTHRTEKRDGSPANDLEIAYDLGEGYAWVYSYVGLEDSSAWRLRELTDALGLKAKGALDTEKIKGKKVRVKINPDTYNDEYRARIGRVMAYGSDNGDGPTGESDDGPDADAGTSGDVDEDELFAERYPNAPDDFVPSREGDEGIDSYDDWAADDVKGEVSDRGIVVSGRRKTQKALIEALRQDDSEWVELLEGGSADAEGDDDGDGDGESEAEASAYPEGYEPQRETDDNSYDDWDEGDLEGELNDRGLEVGSGRGNKKAKIIKALREDDENPLTGEAAGDGDGADEYDDWDLEQLVSEAKERELDVPRGRVTKDKIITILRKNDAEDPF